MTETLDTKDTLMARYKLVGKKTILAVNLAEVRASWVDENRIVAKTFIGEIEVSTVFLVLDHRFHDIDPGPPILFETIIFGGSLDKEETRYSTWKEAKAGHLETVSRVKLACEKETKS